MAGGATAAARIRRNTEQAEIILFEKGEHISYANCGLPYYIGGVIEERERLFVQTPEAFGRRFNIDVRVNSEVVGIYPDRKSVRVRTSDGREYTESYVRLCLALTAREYLHCAAWQIPTGSRNIYSDIMSGMQ